MTDAERLAHLEAELASLHAYVRELLAENAALKRRLAHDSHNSSKPPASDGLARRPQPTRRPSGKKPGGPPGHVGQTLAQDASPHLVTAHRPAVCGQCQQPLDGVPGVVLERRQGQDLPSVPDTFLSTLFGRKVVRRTDPRVTTCDRLAPPGHSEGEATGGVGIASPPFRKCPFSQKVSGREQDLPPMRVAVTEHQAAAVRCPTWRAVTRGVFPDAVRATAQYGSRVRVLAVYVQHYQVVPQERTHEALADLFGGTLSDGTLATWVAEAADILAPTVAHLAELVAAGPHQYADETGIRSGGTLHGLHVNSTRFLTHLAWHPKRGQVATAAIGIWPRLQGRATHDRWASYDASTSCTHSLCGAHLLRELTLVAEQDSQAWAGALADLLRGMHTAATEWQAMGATCVPDEERTAWIAPYHALLAGGFAAQPPPAARSGRQRGRPERPPAKKLLDALLRHSDRVLAFLDDLTIPFTNNQAERDRRMAKVQQKVGGIFRSDAGDGVLPAAQRSLHHAQARPRRARRAHRRLQWPPLTGGVGALSCYEPRKEHMKERDERDALEADGRSFLGGQAVGGKPAHTESKEDRGIGLASTPHFQRSTPALQLLRLDHAPALLAFERENRAYFAASVPDRGDEFFTEFDARHAQLLEWQAAGTDYFHLLVTERGEVVGRVNVYEVAEGSAELGYRIALKAAGHGLATAAVHQVRELAATAYGLTRLRARVTVDNPASRKVLEHNGFVAVGELTLNGKPALAYSCELR